MKYLFYAIVFFISCNCFAQKIRYTNSGNQWLSKGTMSEFGCEFTRIRTLGTDTLIHGRIYRPILSTGTSEINGPKGCMGGPPFPAPEMYVREDTVSNMVYYAGADTGEYVLFNFNLNLGDTFVMTFPDGSTNTDTVFRIDSTLINGVYHKIWALSPPGAIRAGQFELSYTVIEGVGTISEYFPPFIGFEHFEMLYCFQQNTINVSITSPFAYISFAGLLAGPYTTDSLCSIVSVNSIDRPANNIAISPNPATGQFTINTLFNEHDPSFLSIRDLTGRIMYSAQPSVAEQATIDCKNWPNGMYLITITNTTGHRYIKKVIVRH